MPQTQTILPIPPGDDIQSSVRVTDVFSGGNSDSAFQFWMNTTVAEIMSVLKSQDINLRGAFYTTKMAVLETKRKEQVGLATTLAQKLLVETSASQTKSLFESIYTSAEISAKQLEIGGTFWQRAEAVGNEFREAVNKALDTDIQLKIGTQNLNVDSATTHVSVQENMTIEAEGTLRSQTDAAYRRPRSMTVISVDMLFSGKLAINEGLRPLLAELYATPITYIEGKLLTDALVNKYSTPEQLDELKRRVAKSMPTLTQEEADRVYQEIISDPEKLKQAMQSPEWFLEYNRSRFEKASADPSNNAGTTTPPPQSSDLQSGSYYSDNLGMTLPVAIIDVSVTAEPDAVDVLRVRLTFLRISTGTFGYGLEFRDRDGNPTRDIDNCPWISKYASAVYLNPGRKFYLEKYAPGHDTKPDLQISWPKYDDRLVRQMLSTDEPFAIESVSCTVSMANAAIPLIGEKYPVVHYMGRSNVQAEIVLATSSTRFVRDFHAMKDELDAIARGSGSQFRDETIEITNGILNLMGARNFLISACVTEPYPESSNTYRIVLKVVQSDYTRDERQRINLWKDGDLSFEYIKEFWDHVTGYARPIEGEFKTIDSGPYSYLDAFSIYPGSSADDPYGPPGPVQESGRIKYKDDEFRNVETLLWGSTPGNGVVTPDLVVATLLNLFWNNSVDWNSQKARQDAIGSSNATWRAFLARAFEPIDEKQIERVIALVSGCFDDGAEDRDATVLIEMMANVEVRTRQPILRPLRSFWNTMWEMMRQAPNAPSTSPITDRELLWDIDVIANSFSGVTRASMPDKVIFFPSFPGTARLTQSVMERERNLSSTPIQSNYPDLQLPTYSELFATESGGLDPVWRKFAPTNGDLGIEPKLEQVFLNMTRADFSGRLAVKSTDPVEPGFFYYWHKRKPAVVAQLESLASEMKSSTEGVGEALGVGSKIRLNWNFDDAVAALAGLGEDGLRRRLHQIINNLDDDIQPESIETARRVQDWEKYKDQLGNPTKENQNYVEILTKDGYTVAAIQPTKGRLDGSPFKMEIHQNNGRFKEAYHNSSFGFSILRQSSDNSIMMAQDAVEQLRDDTFSPVRNYPAFRVYFVEFDNNEGRDATYRGGKIVSMIDDLYSTEAVQKLHVYLSKSDAPTAVIDILNTKGFLDSDTFALNDKPQASTLKKDVDIGLPGVSNERDFVPQDEPTPQADTRDDAPGDKFLSRMKIKTGTGIVIKMGYGSNPDLLETVFTGQISEIQPGPVMTIVAQGYKRELMQQVSAHNSNANPREAILSLLNSVPLPHLGRKMDLREADDKEYLRFVGAQEPSMLPMVLGRRGIIASWLGGSYTTASRNIWLESLFDTARFGTRAYAQKLFEDTIIRPALSAMRWIGLEGLATALSPRLNTTQYWNFTQTTVWDGLQEVARHFPGFICDVRPYGTEGTVFFGLPDQIYQSREPSIKEMLVYDQVSFIEQNLAVDSMLGPLLRIFWSKYGYPPKTVQWLKTAREKHAMSNWMPDFDSWASFSGENGFPFLAAALGFPNVRQTLEVQLGVRDLIWKESDPLGLDTKIESAVLGGYRSNRGRYGMTSAEEFFVQTMRLDVSSQFASVNEVPGLVDFLFRYWFDLPAGGVLPGAWEANVRNFGTWMQMLGSPDSGAEIDDIDDLNLTGAGTSWITSMIGSSATLLTPTTTVKVGEKAYKISDLLKLDYEDSLSRVDEMLRNGIISQEMHSVLKSYLLDIKNQIVGDGVDAYAEAPGKLRAFPLVGGSGEHKETALGWLSFRLLIGYFGDFLQKDRTIPFEAMKAAGAMFKAHSVPPGFKAFRKMHIVTAKNDIVLNNIVASTREMANTIAVRAPARAVSFVEPKQVAEQAQGVEVISPDQEWVYFPSVRGLPFHPGLDRADRKLAVAEEPNANSPDAQAQCLISNMAQAIKPMYRGELKIVGRVINPHDIIKIHDDYSWIYGQIEADTVTHEFTRETGWVTTIEPHAVTSVSSVTQRMATNLFSAASTALLIADDVLKLAAIGTIAAGAIRSVAPIVSNVLKRAGMRAGQEAVGAAAAKSAANSVALIAKDVAYEAGRLAVRNFWPNLMFVGGRMAGYMVWNSFAMAGSNLFTNLSTRMMVNQTPWPIDVKVLSHGGVPLVAGLNLANRTIFTFGDLIAGTYGDVCQAIVEMFEGNAGYINAGDRIGR